MTICALRTRNRVLAAVASVSLGLLVGCTSSAPSPVGDPDPGHHLLDALRPVAAAIPAGVSHVRREFVAPHWDSCDGVRSSYGWDDVTVDVSFDSNGLSDASVLATIAGSLHASGWTYDPASGTGAWYWHRTLSAGHRAEIQLLGGAQVRPANPWDLQATASPVTHPVKGC